MSKRKQPLRSSSFLHELEFNGHRCCALSECFIRTICCCSHTANLCTEQIHAGHGVFVQFPFLFPRQCRTNFFSFLGSNLGHSATSSAQRSLAMFATVLILSALGLLSPVSLDQIVRLQQTPNLFQHEYISKWLEAPSQHQPYNCVFPCSIQEV